jgi:hypothetical protein
LLNVPLKVAFEDLFNLTKDREVTVSDCWVEEDWWVDFKRASSMQDF